MKIEMKRAVILFLHLMLFSWLSQIQWFNSVLCLRKHFSYVLFKKYIMSIACTMILRRTLTWILVLAFLKML